MNYIHHILNVAIAALLVTGCSVSEEMPDDWQKNSASEFIPVSLSFEMTNDDNQGATTRSLVGGVESNSILENLTMKLLCFDQGGLYLGLYDATLTPTTGTTSGDHMTLSPIKGKIEASVPTQTARIHFIANPPAGLLSDASKSYTGWLENRLMQDIALTSDYINDQQISYWGYHRESTSEAMQQYLKPTGEGAVSNTVKLLRDRIKLTMDLTRANKIEGENGSWKDISDYEAIETIDWTIYNGLKKGYLAPFNTEDYSDPFTGYDTATPPLTPYTESDGGRYTTDVTEDRLQSSSTPQYLFEDTGDKEMSIILKITFKKGTTNKVRYHRVLLMADKANVKKLLRNHSYILNVGYLPRATGSSTFNAALTAPPSNNQAASVSPIVPDVSDGDYTLRILGNTTLIYDSESDVSDDQIVEFEFTSSNPENSPLPTDKSVFEIETSTSTGLDNAVDVSAANKPVVVSYDPTTQKGTIKFKVNTPGSTIAYTKIELKETKTGLSRTLEVYAIQKFDLSNVSLTHVGNTNLTVTKNVITVTDGKTTTTPTPTDVTYDVYKLTFDLPSSLPQGMFPLDIKFATSTLNAYSDENKTKEKKVFGVESGATNMLDESNVQTAWNYSAKTWNSWFIYTIPEKPTSNTVTFYFNDVTGSRAVPPTSVGLYLKIDHFGNPVAYFMTKNN